MECSQTWRYKYYGFTTHVHAEADPGFESGGDTIIFNFDVAITRSGFNASPPTRSIAFYTKTTQVETNIWSTPIILF